MQSGKRFSKHGSSWLSLTVRSLEIRCSEMKSSAHSMALSRALMSYHKLVRRQALIGQ